MEDEDYVSADDEYDLCSEDEGHVNTDDEDGLDLPVPETISTPTRDAEGLLRLGQQPTPYKHDIRSAPRAIAHAEIRRRVTMNLGNTDSQFSGATEETIARDKQELLSCLNATLTAIPSSNDHVVCHCAYTGDKIAWTPSPFGISTEAVNPVTRSEQGLKYHADPNIVLIQDFLNRLKRRHPVLILPIVSAWLNAQNIQDPVERNSVMSGAFIGACNMATANKLFGLFRTHQAQLAEWSEWEAGRLDDMIQTLRTGNLTDEQEHQLAAFDTSQLFGRRPRHVPETPVSEVVATQQAIAAKYSITPEDFDELCFIDPPSGKGQRVFYPFHCVSKNMAREAGWDWREVFGFARRRLNRLRAQCNIRAENLGFGEKEMTAELVVYWMTHRVCLMIQMIKDSKEGQTLEEIAWSMLDRWGLPIVPFTHNTFMASFCKGPDVSIRSFH